jgi:hypothetical protein
LLGGVDVSYIRRLEDEGILHGIRLTRSPSAQVFFRLDEIKALVANAPVIDRRRPGSRQALSTHAQRSGASEPVMPHDNRDH